MRLIARVVRSHLMHPIVVGNGHNDGNGDNENCCFDHPKYSLGPVKEFEKS